VIHTSILALELCRTMNFPPCSLSLQPYTWYFAPCALDVVPSYVPLKRNR
jgi:hypothetical protein